MPKERLTTGNQRKVDGKFLAAGDELLSSIQGIDQEEAIAV